MTKRARLITALLAAAFVLPSTVAAATPTAPYIVVLGDPGRVRADGSAAARGQAQATLARAHGIDIGQSFRAALNGFTARLTAAQRSRLAADLSVEAIEPDLYEQTLPAASAGSLPGARPLVTAAEAAPQPRFVDDSLGRIAADIATPRYSNGLDDERPDIDIAILDSGIAPLPDLNVAGGYNCTGTNRAAYGDVYGHGTEVAAVAAALDNDDGIVGVLPGARLWAVKTITNSGGLSLSMAICAVDWVAGRRDPADPTKPLIEVANMSFTIRSGARSPADDGACGAISGDPFHRAICRMTAKGTIGVAAAGNHGGNVGSNRPAAFRDVLTVSALADFDGRAGGLAPFDDECLPEERDEDDTFANFSNYGSTIDLIAPGVCMTMPWIRTGGILHQQSGTSFASPLVAGSIGIYLSRYPHATERQVRQALSEAAIGAWFTGTDPDARRDRLLNLAALPPPDTSPPQASFGDIAFVTDRATSLTGAPLRLTLHASDNRPGSMRFELQRSVNGGSWTGVAATRSATTTATVPFADPFAFRLRATDEAGNVGTWSVGPTLVARVLDSGSKSFGASGTWATIDQSAAFRGAVRKSGSAGSQTGVAPRGRAVAVVVTAGPNRGEARLSLDGVDGTVDTVRSTVQSRRIVGGRSWATDATRDVSVTVLGTSGRPRVEFDALLVLALAP